MKRVTIVTAAAIFVAVIAWDGVEFAGGYNVFPLVIGFFPASFFFFTLMSGATCIAGIVLLIALFRRKFRYSLVLIGVAVISWLSSPLFAARSVFLFGLATRLRQLSSPAEMKEVAHTCLSLMPFGGQVFAPQKATGPRPFEVEETKRVWEAVSSHSFVHLDSDRCLISVEPPWDVRFEWGGALPGHWGVCVGDCHGVRDADGRNDSRRMQTIPFADGMILFRGD